MSIDRHSIIVFVTNLIQFFAYRADYWIIALYHSNEQVGIYAQANRFGQLLWVIPNVLAGLLYPYLTDSDKGITKEDFLKIGRLLNFVNILIGIMVLILAWVLFQYFLPEEFSAAFRPLIIMLPGLFLFSVSIVLAAWFSAKRLLRVNLYGSSICLISILIFDFILIPRYGITGAAISNAIAYSLSAIFLIIIFDKRVTEKFSHMFTLRKSDFSWLKHFLKNKFHG